MNQPNTISEGQIMNYLSVYMDDPRLNVWHLVILKAILSLGYGKGERQIIKVSRSKIMALSHINTIPNFKQLQDFGYIKYSPSYHPRCKSEVELYDNKSSHNL